MIICELIDYFKNRRVGKALPQELSLEAEAIELHEVEACIDRMANRLRLKVISDGPFKEITLNAFEDGKNLASTHREGGKVSNELSITLVMPKDDFDSLARKAQKGLLRFFFDLEKFYSYEFLMFNVKHFRFEEHSNDSSDGALLN